MTHVEKNKRILMDIEGIISKYKYNAMGVLKSKNLYNHMIEMTLFLDDMYSNVKPSHRFWHISNKDFNIKLCPICDKKPIIFDSKHGGYLKYCSRECGKDGGKETKKNKRVDISVQDLHKLIINYKGRKINNYLVGNGYIESLLKNTSFLDAVYENMSNEQRIWHLRYMIMDIIKCQICNNNISTWYKSRGYNTCGDRNCINEQQYITKSNRVSIRLHNAKLKIIKTFNKNHCGEYELKDFSGEMYRYSEFVHINHAKCGRDFQINVNTLVGRNRRQIELCTMCNPLDAHISAKEKELLGVIKRLIIGDVIENNRKIISPYEIDIYIPHLKIGIEFNGDYFHANPTKYNENELISYMGYKKTAKEIWEKDGRKKTMANVVGIKLITIWENDFDVWKSSNELNHQVEKLLS